MTSLNETSSALLDICQGNPPVTDGSWWRHQIETFSALLAICAGNHRSPVNSYHKGQWRGALIFPLICTWTSSWANNREAGDLRPSCSLWRHRNVPFTKASDTELWCVLWSTPEQMVEQTMELPMILDAMTLIATSLQCHSYPSPSNETAYSLSVSLLIGIYGKHTKV